ncbi:transposase [Streptomyces sp. NPDC059866]|uniref:transposase n=1 Tax=Streptomyces sp. NPDC059866 TaxID=3346978 RepID=UPI0036630511
MHQLTRGPPQRDHSAPREEHQALHEARALQQTDEWKQRYKIRAGVEGATSQAVLAHGLRASRYRGLARTSLQHQLTGAAINLGRIDAWLTNRPRARTCWWYDREPTTLDGTTHPWSRTVHHARPPGSAETHPHEQPSRAPCMPAHPSRPATGHGPRQGRQR